MRAIVSMSANRLSAKVEDVLKQISYSHFRNQGQNVTEFEVRSPCRVLVTIENLTRDQVGFPFRSRTRVESAFEVRRLVGSQETDDTLLPCANTLVREIVKSLPSGSWKLLGSRRRGRVEETVLSSADL